MVYGAMVTCMFHTLIPPSFRLELSSTACDALAKQKSGGKMRHILVRCFESTNASACGTHY